MLVQNLRMTRIPPPLPTLIKCSLSSWPGRGGCIVHTSYEHLALLDWFGEIESRPYIYTWDIGPGLNERILYDVKLERIKYIEKIRGSLPNKKMSPRNPSGLINIIHSFTKIFY